MRMRFGGLAALLALAAWLGGARATNPSSAAPNPPATPFWHFTAKATANPVYTQPSLACKSGGTWVRLHTCPGLGGPQHHNSGGGNRTGCTANHVRLSDAGFRDCAKACTQAGYKYFSLECPRSNAPRYPQNQAFPPPCPSPTPMTPACAMAVGGAR